LELAEDPAWLSKATKCIYHHWTQKNAGRNKAGDEDGENAVLN
jgi:hypothetical protein